MVVFGNFGSPGSREPEPAVLQSVRAYWESIREDGRLPRRRDLDPRGLASELNQVFLAEQIAPGHGRFRLAGNFFHDLTGMDVRGMPLTALFEAGSRERFRIGLQGVFEDAVGLQVHLEAERGIGRPALGARLMLLPLLGGTGEPMLALGVLAITGQIGRTPRRFAIATMRTEVLMQSEITERSTRSLEPSAPDASNVDAEGAPRPAQILRLVHSREGV